MSHIFTLLDKATYDGSKEKQAPQKVLANRKSFSVLRLGI